MKSLRLSLFLINSKNELLHQLTNMRIKKNIGNHRLISIISNLAQIFQKCLKIRLVYYLNVNNNLLNIQFKFIAGKFSMPFVNLLMELQRRNKNCKSMAYLKIWGGHICFVVFYLQITNCVT